eukprot:XP_001609085.1 hypothetical protein [Babesia bovis T2Bo]
MLDFHTHTQIVLALLSIHGMELGNFNHERNGLKNTEAIPNSTQNWTSGYLPLFESLLIQKGDFDNISSVDARSCNSLLLKMLPMLRHSCKESICTNAVKFVSKVSKAAVDLDPGISVERVDSGGTIESDMNDIWNALIRCHKDTMTLAWHCDCSKLMCSLLLDLLSRGIEYICPYLVDQNEKDSCRYTAEEALHKPDSIDLIKRLIGFYALWTQSKGHPFLTSRDLDGSPEGASTMLLNDCTSMCNEVEFNPGVEIKREENGDTPELTCYDMYLMTSFGRFYTRFIGTTNLDVRPCLDQLANAILDIELSLLQGDVVTDNGYNRAIVASAISQTARGRELLRSIAPSRCEATGVDTSLCQEPGSTFSTRCHCIIALHSDLCSSVGADAENVKYITDIVLDQSSAMNGYEFQIPFEQALHILEHLCDRLESNQTCAGNMSISVECATPAAVCAIVALAAVMGDEIQLDCVAPGHVRIRLILRDTSVNMAIPDRVFTLLTRLLYAEIRSDALVSMEYHSPCSSVYRTLIVHYLGIQVAGPMRESQRIGPHLGNKIDFDTFVTRLMRLVFFRVHTILLDESKFESFMRTRVDYSVDALYTNDSDLFQEINSGYIDLGDDDMSESVEDLDPTSMSAVDHRIFGFLEYSHTERVDRSLCVSIKTESGNVDCPRNVNGMEDHMILFFEAAFDLCSHMRFWIDEHQLFQHNKVDRLLYQLVMHICHLDKTVTTQRNYELGVLSKITRGYETDIYGDIYPCSNVIDQSLLPNAEEKSACHVNTDLLYLGRSKFTRRSYYTISRLAIEALVKWLSPESAASALCRWAASVPLDTTSRVKANKPETARAIVTLLTMSLLCHGSDISTAQVDSLISTANVCFVNLKVSFDAVDFVESAFELDDLDSPKGTVPIKPDPEEANVKSERLSIVDNIYQESLCNSPKESISSRDQKVPSYVPGKLQSWKDLKLREHRLRQQRIARLRVEMRKKLLNEVVLLLQTCVLFVHVLGYMILQRVYQFQSEAASLGCCTCKLDVLQKDIHRVDEGTTQIIEADGKYIDMEPQNLDTNEALPPMDTNTQSLYDQVIQFVNLAGTTLESLFSACTAVSMSCVTGSIDVATWDNDRFFENSENELELLLHEISYLRDAIQSQVTVLQQWPQEESILGHVALIKNDVESRNTESGESSDEDDLASFVDFDTDRHLGMVMSNNQKRQRTSSRLNDVVLRSEWNCLIKSYLS